VEKIRWGILGPGKIAHKFARALQNVADGELVAVASRSEERSKEFADQYKIPFAFDSYEAMAQSDAVDAVYIATIHPAHLPCARLLLNAKKHVLCEKPLCVNAKEAIALKECAEANGVFLMEALWSRFLPALQEAQKLVRSGAIGEVLGVSADFCYRSSPEKAPRIFQNEIAGGALLDIGVYCLNFAAMILGNDPKEVLALSTVEGNVDTHTHVLLKYQNGAIASLTSAITVEKPGEGYIYGTKGQIRLPKFHRATELYLTREGVTEKMELPALGEGFEEEIIEACNCIRAGKTQSDTLPLEETIRILRLMDRIRAEIDLRYPMDE
jgi:predicted dehydrogenase